MATKKLSKAKYRLVAEFTDPVYDDNRYVPITEKLVTEALRRELGVTSVKIKELTLLKDSNGKRSSKARS